MDGFEISPLDDPPGFRLIGELDIGTLPILEEALATWGPSRPLTLEMSQLRFMDGMTARLLLRHAERMNGAGPLVLEAPTGLPLRVMEVLGFPLEAGVRIRSMSGV